jgi:hypothetical protein
MSSHCCSSKRSTAARRRRAAGLGVVAGAAMGVALASIGTAGAQPDDDPFVDFVTAVGNTNPDATALATQLDATLLSVYPGTTLDSFVADPSTIPAKFATTDPASNDVFTDLLPANATTAQMHEAAQLDNFLVSNDHLVAATLNMQADAGTVDGDAFRDLAQAFDPHAFVVDATTGAITPNDFIGELAANLDTLFTPGGIDAALDPIVDNIIAAFGLGPF